MSRIQHVILWVRGSLHNQFTKVPTYLNYLIFYSAEEGIRVHFEVSFEPIFTAVGTAEVVAVLSHELYEPTYLGNLTALPETLHIEVPIPYIKAGYFSP